jgi:hypothetical protein
MRVIALTVGLIALLLAPTAIAQSCNAPPPSPGTTFSGVASSIIGQNRLCVGTATGSVLVTLADFDHLALPDAGDRTNQKILTRIAKGKRVTCVADDTQSVGTVAVCNLRGKTLGDLMRAAGATGFDPRFMPGISVD